MPVSNAQHHGGHAHTNSTQKKKKKKQGQQAALQLARHERGECPKCGMQVYEVVGFDTDEKNKKLIPRTLPGLVLEARCLLCHPLANSNQVPADAAMMTTAMQTLSLPPEVFDMVAAADGRPQEEHKDEHLSSSSSLLSSNVVVTLKDHRDKTYVGIAVEQGRGVFWHVHQDDKGKADMYGGEFVMDGNGIGFFHGHGTLRSASKGGSVYQGQFQNGQRHGFGQETFANGDLYIGEYQHDKLHGKGKYTWASGTVYEGEWKDDQRHGVGKFTYGSGNVYQGEWKNHKKHGQGEMRYISSGRTVVKGQWCDGKFVKE